MPISVRLTKEQESYIDTTGLNKSEFIRRAVDYYIEYLTNNADAYVITELEKWINDFKCNTNVSNNATNVAICTTKNTRVLHNNTPVLDNNTSVIQNNGRKANFKLELSDLKTIQRLLNNPENSDTVPDVSLKLISKKYDISKGTLQSFITENKEQLKNGDIYDSNGG